MKALPFTKMLFSSVSLVPNTHPVGPAWWLCLSPFYRCVKGLHRVTELLRQKAPSLLVPSPLLFHCPMLGPSFRLELGSNTAHQRGHFCPFSLKLHSTSTTRNPPGPALLFCTAVITIWHIMYHLSILFHLTQLWKLHQEDRDFVHCCSCSLQVHLLNKWMSKLLSGQELVPPVQQVPK